jgi:putative hydrolase of the HAD superfamily
MSGVEAVLFDLDDTLVDWWGSIARTARDACGDDVADRLVQWAHANLCRRRDDVVVVRSPWRLHEYADECWPLALPDLDDDDLRLLQKRFREDLWVGFFPEVVPTLDRLLDRVRMGVLSNNPYLPIEVERLRLRDWMEVAVDVPRELMKPHPEAFARGCAAMGTDPARTAYVGDSIELDVEGALAFGMVAIWLDRWNEPWTPPAGVHRITSLDELPALLASL